jgi:hypothetical protein
MLLQELLWRFEVLTAQFPRTPVLWDIMLYHWVNYPYSLKECSAFTFIIKRSQQNGRDLLTTEDGNTSFLQNTVKNTASYHIPEDLNTQLLLCLILLPYMPHITLWTSPIYTALIWTVPALPGTLHTDWCSDDKKHGTWQWKGNQWLLLCRNTCLLGCQFTQIKWQGHSTHLVLLCFS